MDATKQTFFRFTGLSLLFTFILIPHTHAGENHRPWRHEGLLLDQRDVAFIQSHLSQNPWQSAWADLQARKQRLPSAYHPDRLLILSHMNTIQPNPEIETLIIKDIDAISRMKAPKTELEKPENDDADRFWKQATCDDAFWSFPKAQKIIRYALAFESLRQKKQLNNGLRMQFKQWLKQQIATAKGSATHPCEDLPWFAAARMAAAVVLEERHLYEVGGEQVFLSLLWRSFNRDGEFCYPHLDPPLTIEQNIKMVTGMLLMAEIANHHSDLFYGNDLYHASYGAKNLKKICDHLFHRIQTSRYEFREHWGWLELAAKTYGEPQWLHELQKHRPVFDAWTGGPVTLTHARSLPAEPPDFGAAPDGFLWLYNQTDLSGWQYSSRWYDIDENDFYVEDGVFLTRGASDHWLMTDRMYGNFILRLEYRIGKGSNSGVMIWAPIPGRPSKTGFEVQLLDDAGQPPKIDGSGSLYKVVAPLANAQKPAGEWNDLEITCHNPRLQIILNDRIIQDVNLDELPETQGRRRRGYIGLQDHAHKVAFRNVRIRPLEEIQ
ncbi:MAG: DUF1080 domain-containing protein [Candidatus Omnitrophota bacterium]|jgi:hypothetical protein|nr:MAG: DUF1080 domain-containing protein [Candidatus Omnitrophota bacterium]